MSSRSQTATIGALVIASLAAAFALGGVGTSPARTELTDAEDRAVWAELDEVLLPRAIAESRDQTVPAVARFVVGDDGDYRAIEVECRGNCESGRCGERFRPGCRETEHCERTTFVVDMSFDSEAEAFAWLDQ
ncbi:MAG: hypothetical protein K0V04_44345 [Deltaproteobacteria bacterium]|nr:hypothetical protein [Deltaproteobacteria bacterium]